MGIEDRIQGCLIGAAIGAELGFASQEQGHRFPVSGPADTFNVELGPVVDYAPQANRMDMANVRPIIDIGIRAYTTAGGRATPESFGDLFRDDEGLATPAFTWDGIHSIQEVLKEGMNPRISGFGTARTGLLAAAMPGVGIYHFADPEYAYLDGVELASVAEPRMGADWAALCAAAIATALDPASDMETVIATVLKLAHRNNKELFYTINQNVREGAWRPQEVHFLEWWWATGSRGDSSQTWRWMAPNPIALMLPVLRRYSDDGRKLMAVACAPVGQWGARTVNPVIAGAVAGALHSASIFPVEWREWAEPIAKPWFAIIDVVEKRVKQEAKIADTVSHHAQLSDRVYGAILAGAIGNAMGSPVEGRYYWEIDAAHPGGIQTVLNPACLEGEDDNQMAMHLVETYLDRRGLPVMARHFGKTWYERLNRDHFFVNCMGHTYDMIREGWDPRITGHWNQVTGSTVMCMEPVGMYHVADPEFAMIDATAVSYMYQRGLDVTAAAIICAATAEALSPDATVESVCQAALNASPREPMLTFDKRSFASPYDYIATCLSIADKHTDVMEARAELYEKCLFYHQIDPLELLGLALAMFKIAKGDVRLSAIGGTNIGRDSDTIAGRAAMLAGALRGSANVPSEWVAMFSPEVLTKIKRNAQEFAARSASARTARMDRRVRYWG